jgi:hypothetical protein
MQKWNRSLESRLFRDPDIIQNFHDLFVYREHKCHIEANSTKTWNSAFVKPAKNYIQLQLNGIPYVGCVSGLYFL